jgi:hypothetical protein
VSEDNRSAPRSARERKLPYRPPLIRLPRRRFQSSPPRRCHGAVDDGTQNRKHRALHPAYRPCPVFARKVQCKLSNGVAGFAARGAPLDCQKSWHSRVISTMQIDDPSSARGRRGMLAQSLAAYPRRGSSNANGLCGGNSAGSLEMYAIFQRDSLRRRF